MTSLATARKLPVLFVSHGGGPIPLLDSAGTAFASADKNSPSASFMRGVSKYIVDENQEHYVRNILVISAHWEESQFTVMLNNHQAKSAHPLLYDYGGFPKEAYAPYLTYDAPTDIQLSNRVHELLTQAGVPCRKQERGLDHGAFVPLKSMYPAANIPVIQLSLKSNLSPAEHIRLGELLSPLREEGTLILCSGQITHNMSDMRRMKGDVEPRTVEFIEWIRNTLENTTPSTYGATKGLFNNIQKTCPHFDFCHPRSEHFVPMFVALGATYGEGSSSVNSFDDSDDKSGSEVKGIQRLYSEIVFGSMALDSYIFN